MLRTVKTSTECRLWEIELTQLTPCGKPEKRWIFQATSQLQEIQKNAPDAGLSASVSPAWFFELS